MQEYESRINKKRDAENPENNEWAGQPFGMGQENR